MKKEHFSKRKAFLFQCNQETELSHLKKREKKAREKKTPAYQAGITATILFILTTTAVKYACNRMAIKPTESAR